MDKSHTKRKHCSRSRSESHHKPVKKKSTSRHRDSSSSTSPPRKSSSHAKYHADTSRKEKGKRRKRKVSTSSSSSSPSEKKKRKRKASTSSSSSLSSSSSSCSEESSNSSEHRSKKKKRKEKKLKKKKKVKKKSKKHNKKDMDKIKGQETPNRTEEFHPGPSLDLWQKESMENTGPVLTDEQKTRIQAMKPMTKEEWDARQSVIRRVMDPETGRMRLIKGDGEVLEEIVSKDRHREINKIALMEYPPSMLNVGEKKPTIVC